MTEPDKLNAPSYQMPTLNVKLELSSFLKISDRVNFKALKLFIKNKLC